jgi:hypothetical protein
MISNNNILVENKKGIYEIKKFHDSPRLNDVIKKKFPNETPSFYFQIKSEIKRLGKTCNRILDLRNKLKNEACEEIEFNGIRHYLNESAAIAFKTLTTQYSHQYTFGVYECINDLMKELQQKEINEMNNIIFKIDKKEKEAKKSLSVVRFADFFTRKEERMHFAVSVSIFDNNESDLGETAKKIKAAINRGEPILSQKGLTTDISLNGLGIKVIDKIQYTKGQKVIVRMTGMEDDFMITQPFIEYEIMKIEEKSKFKYIALRKIDNELNKEINTYTKNLINSHKRRYKVELDNVVDSAFGKGHEQFYISRLTCLPLYFSFNNNELNGKYGFINESNSEVLHYFKEVAHNNIFEQVIKKSDISKFISKDKISDIAYLAVFNVLKDGKKHYYAYSTNDNNDSLFQKFLGYGLKRNTLKVIKFDFTKIDAIKDCFVPSALPSEVLKQVMPHELKLSPQIENALRDINIMGVVTEVTKHYDLTRIKESQLTRDDIAFLNQCQIKKYETPAIKFIEAESNDFRAEDRFLVNTKITFQLDGQDYVGYTSDLSTKGFRARLENSAHIAKNDKIKITFDDYEYKQNNYNLKNIGYKIVHKHNDIIACRITGDIKSHDGAIFWRKYIYSNYHKLRATGTNDEILGLSKSLRNIFSRNHNNLPCFYEIKNKQINPFMLSYSNKFSERFDFFKKLDINEKTMGQDLRSFFFNQNLLDRVDQAHKDITKEKPFVSIQYFVNAKKMQSGKKFFKIFFEDQIGCTREKKDFLNPTDGSETFVFEMQITKKSRVFNKYFKNEISYIESYAAHKAEELLEELSRISGVIEIKDITNIIKSQYN